MKGSDTGKGRDMPPNTTTTRSAGRRPTTRRQLEEDGCQENGSYCREEGGRRPRSPERRCMRYTGPATRRRGRVALPEGGGGGHTGQWLGLMWG